jgi:hypothetical protein
LIIVNGWQAKSNPSSRPVDRRPSGDPRALDWAEVVEIDEQELLNYRKVSVSREFHPVLLRGPLYAVTREFQREHPGPSTGKKSGAPWLSEESHRTACLW